MNRAEFVKEHLDDLLKNEYIAGLHNDRPNSAQQEEIKLYVEKVAGDAYDTIGKEYFETKGVGGYASSLLRTLGLAADVIGDYTFWAFGLGAVSKLAGAGLKTTADAIDGAHYSSTRKDSDLVDAVEIGARGGLARILGYVPLLPGAGIIDYIDGSNKFDVQIEDLVKKYVIGAVRKRFDPMYKPARVPLKNYGNPNYKGNTIDDAVQAAA